MGTDPKPPPNCRINHANRDPVGELPEAPKALKTKSQLALYPSPKKRTDFKIGFKPLFEMIMVKNSARAAAIPKSRLIRLEIEMRLMKLQESFLKKHELLDQKEVLSAVPQMKFLTNPRSRKSKE